MGIYGKPDYIADGTQAVIGTTELDLFVITEQDKLTESQLSAYITFALGTHTSMEFRYYARFTPGGTWFQLPFRNESTGAITSVPYIANASTPATFLDSLPLPACMEFKATVRGVGGTGGSATMSLMSRDN